MADYYSIAEHLREEYEYHGRGLIYDDEYEETEEYYDQIIEECYDDE